MKKALPLTPLAYQGHEKSKMTLHLFLQLIGKIRMNKTQRKNHWWYITEYVDTKGLTTGPIPYAEGTESFSITLNVLQHCLEVENTQGDHDSFPLYDGLTVAAFYNQLSQLLKKQSIPFYIVNKPFDLGIEKRFDEIDEYHHYDPEYTRKLWKILGWVAAVFQEFSGRFYGKTCPVHLYWHSMDLTVTRFSGKKAPAMPASARLSDKDAYSHEVISFGFWPGDQNVPEPAFYAYTYPSPKGLENEPIAPAAATWVDNNNSAMALLKYQDLLQEAEPKQALLDFMESTYQAGAKLAHWDLKAFEVPPLNQL